MAFILYGDGIRDDTAALTAWYCGENVRWADGPTASREKFHPDNPMSGRRAAGLRLQNNCPCGVFHPWRDDDKAHAGAFV